MVKDGMINGVSLAALCTALGPGWTWTVDDMGGWCKLHHADLLPGALHLSVPWNAKKRIEASAHRQTITVAAERGAEVIAREINRRLMPEARRKAIDERAFKVQEASEHQARIALAGRLGEIAGQPSQVKRIAESERERSFYLSGKDWNTSVELYSRADELTIRGHFRADDWEAMQALLCERVEARRLAAQQAAPAPATDTTAAAE